MPISTDGSRRVLVVGGGPAGLTAAFEAQSAGFKTVVLEKDSHYLGGLARTVVYKGYRFDIGGHRFFTKNDEVSRWWQQRLPDEFIQVKRSSRIFYRRRFFDYPLRPWNALKNLGPLTSLACVASYFWARCFPRTPEISFEDWVINRFGQRLFRIFFKTYTEKIWGIPTNELSADWAAQRIRGLSLWGAIINAFRKAPGSDGGAVIKTLVDRFHYPRLGPGQMWERTAEEYRSKGGELKMGMAATRIHHADGRVTAITATDDGGQEHRFEADDFIISMPLREAVLGFDPPLPETVRAAAQRLSYRDFLTVALVIEGANPFPDNWIYIHDEGVKLGRIQNFKNWSEAMIGDPGTTCLGLEYFCFAGDGLWTMSDTDLLAMGRREIVQLGLVADHQVRDGTVVRAEKAYPIYRPGYEGEVNVIREALGRYAANLQVVGRNGMHRYNNQDHSMLTAMLAVKNLQGGRFSLWNVNSDAEYHEEVRAAPETT